MTSHRLASPRIAIIVVVVVPRMATIAIYHTHIYIRTVAFTRRCTTADRAVSELDIVVVGAREVK